MLKYLKEGIKLTREEWYALKDGDVIRHKYGDIERIVEYQNEAFIEGERDLFPLSEFDWNEWTLIKGV